MAEYGNREIGIVQDALKEIYDELLDGGAVEFRKNLLRNLMQSMETKASYTTHAVAVFDAYQPLEKNFRNLNLETMVNYAFANLEVLIEMEQLDNMRQPDQMWTGYEETSEAIQEIAEALNEGFDFEIDTNQDIYDLTREMSEQLEGSNIKVQDVPMALELQIRTLDDMKYFEFGSITAAFHSTEVMRPFTVQLVEIYNQIEDLPEDLVSNLYAEIADNLGLKEGPSDYLRAYDNPNNSEAKAVKNVIKYFFEQQGRQQTGYMNFSSVDNMYLDGGQMYSHIDSADSVAAYVGEIMQNNIELFLPNSTQPVQLLNSVRPFEMVSQPFPLEISGDYINEYNKIIGTTIIDNPTVSNKTVDAFADMNNLVTGEPLTVGEIAKELGLPERLHTIDLPSTPTNVVGNIANYIEDYEELVKMQKNLDKNITGELPVEQVAYMYDEALLERGNISYEDFHNNYPKELGKVSRYQNKIFNKEYITFEDFYNELTDGYQLKENVTPEQFKNSLENFINEIENPRLQEGIQTKYSKYNNFIENIVDIKVKDRILTLVNQDIFTDIISYNEYLYTLDTNEDIETGFFDYEEPTPVEDAFLADREGWDVDKEGNFIKPEKPNVGTYEGRLNSYYELALEDDAKFNNYRNTPTNVVDLDEVISQSDGVDNLNKSKEIMQKNPGIFRKVFSVLEKLDIGDQVITKAVAKGLPAIGLGAMAPGAAIAYGAYEMSILLTDAAQAYNKMQTTDEGFWENFGELSDKYSIAYKISKPVYDIILDSLNDDLTTEGQDEEILFSFNR